MFLTALRSTAGGTGGEVVSVGSRVESKSLDGGQVGVEERESARRVVKDPKS